MMDESVSDQDDEQEAAFDFDSHARQSTEAYEHVRPIYQEFAADMRDILTDALLDRGIKAASIDARAKTLESFRAKVSHPSSDDPASPKYPNPLEDLTDLTGARVIVFFPKDLSIVEDVIQEQFEVVERSDKREALFDEERFGYQSIHFLVRLRSNRSDLPEYARFRDRIAEIQLRTVLQHAWAEIEHDIQYKSVETIPASIRRRFMSLGGVLEIADREFQAIQDEDEALRLAARESVETGALEEVGITADALKAYLDKKYGPDARLGAWSYEYMARQLVRLGFRDMDEVDQCVKDYDDDQLSRIVWGSRQGPVWRFDAVLLAALGEVYLSRLWGDVTNWRHSRLANIRRHGISISNFIPGPPAGGSVHPLA